MAAGASLVHSSLRWPSSLLHYLYHHRHHHLRTLALSVAIAFPSSAATSSPFSILSSVSLRQQSKRPPVAAALLELGGVKVFKEDVVREGDPANNVPDTIFPKLGLQLHRRDNHPLGILKNAIYDYFDVNYSDKFVMFDDLCPIVSVKEVYFICH